MILKLQREDSLPLIFQGSLSQEPLELANTISSSLASPVPTTRWSLVDQINWCLSPETVPCGVCLIWHLSFSRERKNKGKSKAPAPLSPQVIIKGFYAGVQKKEKWKDDNVNCWSGVTFNIRGLLVLQLLWEGILQAHQGGILSYLDVIFVATLLKHLSGQSSLCRRKSRSQVMGIQGNLIINWQIGKMLTKMIILSLKAWWEGPFYIHRAKNESDQVVGRRTLSKWLDFINQHLP